MRRMGLKDVPHYAPDVGLTAVDYIEPISPEKRLRRAELQIDKFLKETSPDRFSGSFFDAYTEQEGKLLISLLEEQKTWHEGVNSSIVLKHESELIRVRRSSRPRTSFEKSMRKSICCRRFTTE